MSTQPVTTTGWYENNDGTVTYRFWQNGRLCDGETVASWSEVDDDKTYATAQDFCDAHAFTADDYPEADCAAANTELLRLASEPANRGYLELDAFGGYIRDGRDLCDRANNNL